MRAARRTLFCALSLCLLLLAGACGDAGGEPSGDAPQTSRAETFESLPATLPAPVSDDTQKPPETSVADTSEAETSAAETTEAETEDIFAAEIVPPVNANAAEPLNIKTYDGYNQACHPKVLYFEDGWNGWEYWMAYTPYPYCDDDYENPCIAVSHDGIEWTEPEGISNPVTGFPPTLSEGAHYSDPHILVNGDVMELWFRWNPSYGNGVNADSNGGVVLRCVSENGISWSKPETMLAGSEYNYDPVLSPVVMADGGGYTMWYSKRDGKIWRTTSADGHEWSELEAADLSVWGYDIWHQDIIFSDGIYEIVFCARPQNSENNLVGLEAFYARSYDGLHFTEPVKIVSPDASVSGYDDCSIYRLSLLRTGGGYRLYYSSMSSWYVWKINLASGGSISELVGMGRDGFESALR